MASNPSFSFVKHVMRNSSKMRYIEHLLPSSSSLKNKEVLSNHGGGGDFEGSGSSFKIIMAVVCCRPLTWNLFASCLKVG